MHWATTTAWRDDKHLSFAIWYDLYKRFDGNTPTTDTLGTRGVLYINQSIPDLTWSKSHMARFYWAIYYVPEVLLPNFAMHIYTEIMGNCIGQICMHISTLWVPWGLTGTSCRQQRVRKLLPAYICVWFRFFCLPIFVQTHNDNECLHGTLRHHYMHPVPSVLALCVGRPTPYTSYGWFQDPLLLTWFNFNPSMDK